MLRCILLVTALLVAASPVLSNDYNNTDYYKVVDGCPSNGAHQPSSCANEAMLAAVRCCVDDSYVSGSNAKCTSYCTEASIGNYVMYERAKEICAGYNRRLCTAYEVTDRGDCCNSGCGHDHRKIWTKDPCDAHAGSSQYINVNKVLFFDSSDVSK